MEEGEEVQPRIARMCIGERRGADGVLRAFERGAAGIGVADAGGALEWGFTD